MQRRNRTLIIIAIAAAVLLCICVAAAVGIFAIAGRGVGDVFSDVVGSISGGLNDDGDAFLNALKDRDFGRAHGEMHPDLQVEVGSATAFQREIEGANFSAESWRYTSTSVNNDDGELEGVVTDVDGDKWDFYLAFVREGDTWWLVEYQFEPH